MTREEAIRELREDKALYETDNCHAGDGSPDGDLLEALDMAIEALSDRPTDEWCSDCKEYDHEKHCCPRFNRVIRTTLDELVRCKDCRHIGLFSCPLADNDFQKDEDFCSWGERKEP